MDTNRLSPALTKSLNAQMTNEAHNAQIYLSYASWASEQGYDGIANFLFRHQREERNHMMPKPWIEPIYTVAETTEEAVSFLVELQKRMNEKAKYGGKYSFSARFTQSSRSGFR